MARLPSIFTAHGRTLVRLHWISPLCLGLVPVLSGCAVDAGSDGSGAGDSGAASGGALGSGGATSGSGGAELDGPSSGGSGGLGSGGLGSGGIGSGGAGTGGAGSGGTGTGATAPGAGGDVGTGGAGNTGGTGGENGGTGGATSCEYSEPPASVAAWVDESWNAQLGGNIQGREAWLLDSVMMGQGQLNLCVRWGATSPPSSHVKENIGAAVERWMNDWFTALGDYGCFPYPDGIDVQLTGWAVPPGNESWVSDLDDSVGIYTETDGEGQPKCPDVCSFFVNWDHQFPQCPGGEAFHTDYWIWVSDQLPGGGAAAVGGDWGLRMPVASLENRIDATSDYVIEHEIGHGFGFQDYYDWNGSRPDGGSLMIVGSTNMQSPTEGDTWLIRRTWEEMQVLRGW